MAPVVVSWGLGDKPPQTGGGGGLKQQKSILSWFWRPEVQNHGVGRAVLPPKALAKNLPASSSVWWPTRYSARGFEAPLTPASVVSGLSLCLCGCRFLCPL